MLRRINKPTYTPKRHAKASSLKISSNEESKASEMRLAISKQQKKLESLVCP